MLRMVQLVVVMEPVNHRNVPPLLIYLKISCNLGVASYWQVPNNQAFVTSIVLTIVLETLRVKSRLVSFTRTISNKKERAGSVNSFITPGSINLNKHTGPCNSFTLSRNKRRCGGHMRKQ